MLEGMRATAPTARRANRRSLPRACRPNVELRTYERWRVPGDGGHVRSSKRGQARYREDAANALHAAEGAELFADAIEAELR